MSIGISNFYLKYRIEKIISPNSAYLSKTVIVDFMM